MEVTTDRLAVVTALRRLEPEGEPPATARLRIDAQDDGLVLSTWSREQMRTTTAEAVVASPGSVVLPQRMTQEWLRNEDCPVLAIQVAGSNCQLIADPNRIDLRTYDATDWPNIQQGSGGSIQLGPDLLRGMERVLHAAAEETDSRPLLSAVAIGGGWIVGTDTHRLAAAEAPDVGDEPLLVPRSVARLVLALSSGLVCEVVYDDSLVTFTVGNTKVTSSLMAGAFPDWKAFMPAGTPDGMVVADRQELLIALRRLSAVGSLAHNKAVTISQAPDGQLNLATAAPDVGRQDEYVRGSTTESIKLNIPNLRDLVQELTSVEVRFDLHTSTHCAIAKESGFIGLVMMIRS